MNSDFLYTKKIFYKSIRKYFYMIPFMIVILCVIGVISFHHSHFEYISITETRHDNSKREGNDLVVSLYTYTLSNGKMNKVYELPLTAQYSLGVVDLSSHCVFYTRDVNDEGDQIFSYDLRTRKTKQLTSNLFAVNYIIPTKDYLFFAAASHDAPNVALGCYEKSTGKLSYWGDDGDTNVECMCVNRATEKIYVATYSESEDRYNLQHQTNDDFKIADHSVWELDYSLKQPKKLFTLPQVWIRMLIPNGKNISVIYDLKYNASYIPSRYFTYDLQSNEKIDFPAPPYRIQKGDAAFSSDLENLFVLSSLPDDTHRNLYQYNVEEQSYSLIFQASDHSFINNYQVIQT